MEQDQEAVGRIRVLNDKLRCTGAGGTIVVTPGIIELGADAMARIAGAIAAFNDFTEDNDPHGEHDCASVTVDGVNVLWKIDYYDLKCEHHSSDAADPKVTARVLTIMRAEEY
jgi:hypothetical protein